MKWELKVPIGLVDGPNGDEWSFGGGFLQEGQAGSP